MMTPQRSPAGVMGGGGGGTPALHYLSGPYGDTTYTKVFVGGLAWETRSEGLRAHFEAYGDILEAVVITDRATGRSKGYGFVTFRDPDSARMACMDPYPVIDGRRANCNLAILGRPGPAVPFCHQRMDRSTCIHSFVECLWSICWTTVCPGIWWSQNSRPSSLPIWAVRPTCAK